MEKHALSFVIRYLSPFVFYFFMLVTFAKKLKKGRPFYGLQEKAVCTLRMLRFNWEARKHRKHRKLSKERRDAQGLKIKGVGPWGFRPFSEAGSYSFGFLKRDGSIDFEFYWKFSGMYLVSILSLPSRVLQGMLKNFYCYLTREQNKTELKCLLLLLRIFNYN